MQRFAEIIAFTFLITYPLIWVMFAVIVVGQFINQILFG